MSASSPRAVLLEPVIFKGPITQVALLTPTVLHRRLKSEAVLEPTLLFSSALKPIAVAPPACMPFKRAALQRRIVEGAGGVVERTITKAVLIPPVL